MEVTRDELASALGRTWLTVHDKDGLTNMAGCFKADTLVTRANGRVMFPEDVAEGLLTLIETERRTRDAERAQCRIEGPRCNREGIPCTCPPAELEPEVDSTPAGREDAEFADQELSFLAECVRRLDAMGDLSVNRCMSYLADRYPPE